MFTAVDEESFAATAHRTLNGDQESSGGTGFSTEHMPVVVDVFSLYVLRTLFSLIHTPLPRRDQCFVSHTM